MVPPCSDRVSRAPPYLSYAQYHHWIFGYGAFTLCCWLSQVILLIQQLSHTGCSDFARHYSRNLGWFLFLWVLRCFSSPSSLLTPYVFRCWYPYGWVSPFGHLRINACLSAPRSFSQTTTSFIACDRQGIHQMHLVAWLYKLGLQGSGFGVQESVKTKTLKPKPKTNAPNSFVNRMFQLFLIRLKFMNLNLPYFYYLYSFRYKNTFLGYFFILLKNIFAVILAQAGI